MTRAQIEGAIVQQLQSVVKNRVVIAPSPSDPDEWQKLGAKGCVLVRYMGGRRVESNTRNPARRMKFHTYSGVKDLRPKGKAHFGAYDLLDYTEVALDGYVIDKDIDNGLILMYEGDAYHKEIGGVWWYVTEFSTNAYRLTLPEIGI